MKQVLLDFVKQYIQLNQEEEEALLSLDIFRTFPKGTVLLQEGQMSDLGYFVLKGCIRTYYNMDGEEKTTEFYTELQGLTPHCVTSKQASDYYVACVEDSILTVANPDLEEEMFKKFPKFESMCRVMAEQLLANKQTHFDDFKTSSPEQRYLNLIQNRPDLLQRVPLNQLASYLGITVQSLSRLRARVAKKQL